MMYEGEDGNAIDPLYETSTTERNGVKIIIPINYGDRGEFVTKIMEQLAYFENVYFNVSGIDNSKVKITRNEHFQHSTLVETYLPNMHICLDNVYYPLDFQKLGIPTIKLNLGLRFSLSDGLFPTPNRESLRYTKEAKEVILNKLEKVANYFVEKYNSTITESEDVVSTLPRFGDSSHYLQFELGNWKIDNISVYSKIPYKTPTIKGIEISDLSRIWKNIDYLLKPYTIAYEFRSKRFKSCTNKWEKSADWRKIVDYPCYKFTEKLEHSFKSYFRENISHSSAYFIKQESSMKLGKSAYRAFDTGYDSYMAILDLKSHPKSQWRKRIQECQYIISKIIEKTIDVDKYVIPKEWFEKKKKIKMEVVANRKERIQKLSGEVSAKELQKLDRYVSNDRYAKLVPIIINLENAHISPKFTIYGGTESSDLLERWYSITTCVAKHLRFLVFSERELKKLKDIKLHNLVKIEDFMKGTDKPFKRAVTAEVISRFMKRYSNVFDKKGIMTDISTQLSDKMKLLEEYHDKYHVSSGSQALFEIVIPYAEEHNAFDEEIYTVYKELNRIFGKLPFLNPMFGTIRGYSSNESRDEMVMCIKDLFKYYKQRMNWQNYLKLNAEEETVKETEITDELVSQSV